MSSVVFVRSRFLREVSQRGWCFGHHGKQKSFREREREKEREGESAPRERQTDAERHRKTEKDRE